MFATGGGRQTRVARRAEPGQPLNPPTTIIRRRPPRQLINLDGRQAPSHSSLEQDEVGRPPDVRTRVSTTSPDRGSPCDAGSRCAQWPDTILSRDDLTRDVRHRTRDKTVAITYGVQTMPNAVVRMNVFRVPTGRAVDPGGAFVAGGFERFDSRSHAATVSQLGCGGIRRRGTLGIRRKT